MSSRIFPAPDDLNWKKAYIAAILEKDRSRLPGLIHAAKEQLSERLRELLVVESVPYEEIEAIDDALYLLHALFSSLSHSSDICGSARSYQDS